MIVTTNNPEEIIEAYLEKPNYIKHRKFNAKLTGKKHGYVSSFATGERVYYELIFYNNRLIYIELSPCITCPEPYINMLRDYFGEINSTNMVANFRVERNGYIYVHVSTFYDEEIGISSEIIEQLEGGALSMITDYQDGIQRICSGKMLQTGDNPIDKMIERIDRVMGSSDDSEEDDQDLTNRRLPGTDTDDEEERTIKGNAILQAIQKLKSMADFEGDECSNAENIMEIADSDKESDEEPDSNGNDLPEPEPEEEEKPDEAECDGSNIQ